MRSRLPLHLVLFVLVSCAGLGTADANLITNGSFESGTSPGGGNLVVEAGETDITAWTIDSGSVDYIEEPYWQASEGARSLDLNGDSPGTISQSIPTVPGQGYQIRFALAGNPDSPGGLKTVRVSAAATTQDFSFDSSGHSHASMGWVEEATTFVATSATTTLTFEGLTSGAMGPAIDDVRVTAVVLDGCGDGNLDLGEECDDGGTSDGDGCDAECGIEPCWACGGEPSVCELALKAEAVDTTGDVGHYASIAIGDDGLPVISHYDDGLDDLRVTHCDDPACATQATTVVADGFEVPINGSVPGTGDSGAHSQIVIGSDGLPFITYQARGLPCVVSSSCTALRAAHCNDAACTMPVSVGEIDFTGDGPGEENSVAVRPGGLPVVAWGRSVTASAGLRVADCESVACNSAIDHSLHGDANDRATAMTIGDDEFPLIVFRDGSDDLRVAHCNDPGCSSASLDTLDVDAGIGNSIATGTDGFGIVSYLDFTVSTTVNTVRVIHCTNAACSTSDAPVTIDTPDAAGGNTSIAIGTGGRPLIAYQDLVNGELKLARCNDPTCGSGAVFLTLDNEPASIGVLDIATTSGGTSYIAYRDATVANDGDLKLAICGPVCGDGNVTPDEECDDGGNVNGDGCNAICTVEACWTCNGEPSTCSPLDCSDGSVCTQDSCNPLGVCVHDPTPVANCKTAEKSLLLLKDNGADDKLLFKWTNGEPLTQTELGDPTASTEYALCIYKGAANDELIDIAIPAGTPGWSELSDKGYKYKDPDATSSGVAKVLLKGDPLENKSKVLLKGSGIHLPDPVLGDLPLPVTAQLINPDSGTCVEAVFDTNVKKNTASQFKAKAP